MFVVCVRVHTASFPNNSGPISKSSIWKWKPLLLPFLEKHDDVTCSGEMEKEPPLADNSPMISGLILICIFLPGNDDMMWSNAMLFCSRLSGQRKKWKREKSEYSSLSAWRLGCFVFGGINEDFFALQTDSCAQSPATPPLTWFHIDFTLPPWHFDHIGKHAEHSTVILLHGIANSHTPAWDQHVSARG